MGLYGSEYWTYTLPRRVGDLQALALTEECKPVSANQAARIGLVDQLVEFSETDGLPAVQQMVQALLFNFNWEDFLKKKIEKFDPKEAEKYVLYTILHQFLHLDFRCTCFPGHQLRCIKDWVQLKNREKTKT